MSSPLRLGVNIDHVATLRNARGAAPVTCVAALLAQKQGQMASPSTFVKIDAISKTKMPKTSSKPLISL